MPAADVPDATRIPLPFVLTREQMLLYTRQYEGERFSDGRPRVADSILERMKRVTCEQAWTVLREHGYQCQYQGNVANVCHSPSPNLFPNPEAHILRGTLSAGYAPERRQPNPGILQ